MIMNNMEIREAIERKRIRYWEVAKALGINECTLSRWLREDVSETRKKEILTAISKIS